jgi:glycosyltransferase involved in cell wall biosynthesis
MKVAQIIPGLGICSGGPSRSVFDLTKGLRSIGIDASIYTNDDPSDPLLSKEHWIFAARYNKHRLWGYNPAFSKLIKSSSADLFHIHSIYSYSSTIASHIARKRGIPYIIAPRGSLYQSALEISKWKKTIFNYLILNKDLNNSTLLHVTCKEEMRQIREMGIHIPIAIIPNSIHVHSLRAPVLNFEKKRLGYIGRISPIKNLESLVEAWYRSGLGFDNHYELVFIGGSNSQIERNYEAKLKRMASDYNLINIRWEGFLFGHNKEDICRELSYTILPSFSENFGMVVPESYLNGIPVIASKGTPWESLVDYNCGWWVEGNVDCLVSAILSAFSQTNDQRLAMIDRGREMVINEYSTESVCSKMTILYNYILGGGDKPKFVFTD